MRVWFFSRSHEFVTPSDNRADVSRGRVTRVWEAFREEDPDRTSVVVKDVWTLFDAV
jgi:hypothetical protein